jgi:2-methylcitrate dehydratase PrpD
MATQMASNSTASSGLTLDLARQAAGTGYAALSGESRALVRQCVLDYIGVTLAGARDNVSNAVLAEMADMGGKPEAAVFGRGVRLPALSAALVNGTASHALDFDDVNMSMPGHVTVAVLPGLLALGEARKSSGRDIMQAFVSGYELACRVGNSVAPGHYQATGFHATGTVGALGSAASAGRLLGLSAEDIATAVGVAATQSAGLKSLFGTDCKPFHAGKAAQNGLMAARLVSRGFTAHRVPSGICRHTQPRLRPRQGLRRPHRRWPALAQQPLQVPRRLLSHARRDRGLPAAQARP